MTRKRKVLVAVDLTTESPREARFAAELASALSAELLLCHVIDYVPGILPFELPSGAPVPQLDLVREIATQKLQRIAASTGSADVRVVLESGGAADRIVDVAERENADLIVVGSHRQNAVARALLGSVADRVAHTAPCPVTIAHEIRRRA